MNSVAQLIGNETSIMYFSMCIMLNVLLIVGFYSKDIKTAKMKIMNTLPFVMIIEVLIPILVMVAKAKLK